MTESIDRTPGGEAKSTLRSFDQIPASAVQWLWRDRVAVGKITGLAGRPKVGKGLMCSNLTALVTCGELEGDLAGPRNVILVTTEDEPGDTLKPRLISAGADLSRVSHFEMGAPDAPVPFRVPQHAEELAQRVAETAAALVIIDPLIEFLDGKIDAHKSQPVRQAIASLNQIARTHDCAIVAIIHLNKSTSNDPLVRHEASAAFSQIMRSTLLLARDPDDPDGERGNRRVLAVTSSNLAREAPSLLYEVRSATVESDSAKAIESAQIVHIGGSPAEGSDLLGSMDAATRSDRDEAIEFLRSELADGPLLVKDVHRAANEAGVGPGSLKRAKRVLGVASKKQGMDRGWVWELPQGSMPKGTDTTRSLPSPSSPSSSEAESQAPSKQANAEEDGRATGGLRPATQAEEAEADRIAAKFGDVSSGVLVDAAEVARRFSVSKFYVYEHADELGAVRLGRGSRPRLRFDLTTVQERLTQLTVQDSEERQRSNQSPSRRAGSVDLLPIKGEQ